MATCYAFVTLRQMFPGAQLKDPQARCVAKHALEILWSAMDLSSPPCGNVLPDGPTSEEYDERLKAWNSLAETILGKDATSHEIKT